MPGRRKESDSGNIFIKNKLLIEITIKKKDKLIPRSEFDESVQHLIGKPANAFQLILQ